MLNGIIKRDGRLVMYDISKIKMAVLKAMEADGKMDFAKAEEIAVAVERHFVELGGNITPTVEEIQDQVEIELMRAGFDSVALHCPYRICIIDLCLCRQVLFPLKDTFDVIFGVQYRLVGKQYAPVTKSNQRAFSLSARLSKLQIAIVDHTVCNRNDHTVVRIESLKLFVPREHHRALPSRREHRIMLAGHIFHVKKFPIAAGLRMAIAAKLHLRGALNLRAVNHAR